MTAKAKTPGPRKTAILAAMGMGLLALPLALPSTARADDFRISLNLGGGGYYPVYYQPPVQKVVYRPAPRHVVYRPVYREKVVYRDYRGHHGHGRHQHAGRGHGRWDDRRTAWR